MMLHHLSRGLIAGMVLWLLALPMVISAHEQANGNGPHEHDGQVCVLALSGADDVLIIPEPLEEVKPVLVDTPIWLAPVYDFAVRPNLGARAPPPRAPPFETL